MGLLLCPACNEAISFDINVKHICKYEDIIAHVKKLEDENRLLRHNNNLIEDAVDTFVCEHLRQLDEKSVVVSTESIVKLYEGANS